MCWEHHRTSPDSARIDAAWLTFAAVAAGLIAVAIVVAIRARTLLDRQQKRARRFPWRIPLMILSAAAAIWVRSSLGESAVVVEENQLVGSVDPLVLFFPLFVFLAVVLLVAEILIRLLPSVEKTGVDKPLHIPGHPANHLGPDAGRGVDRRRGTAGSHPRLCRIPDSVRDIDHRGKRPEFHRCRHLDTGLRGDRSSWSPRGDVDCRSQGGAGRSQWREGPISWRWTETASQTAHSGTKASPGYRCPNCWTHWQEILSALRLPAYIANGSIGDGELKGSFGAVQVFVQGEIDSFPGMRRSRPLVVVDRRRLIEAVGDEGRVSGSRYLMWTMDRTEQEVEQGLAQAGIGFAYTIEAATTLDQLKFAAVVWTFDFLEIYAALGGAHCYRRSPPLRGHETTTEKPLLRPRKKDGPATLRTRLGQLHRVGQPHCAGCLRRSACRTNRCGKSLSGSRRSARYATGTSMDRSTGPRLDHNRRGLRRGRARRDARPKHRRQR